MQHNKRKILIVAVICVAAWFIGSWAGKGVVGSSLFGNSTTGAARYKGVDLTTDVEGFSREDTYSRYSAADSNTTAVPSQQVTVDIAAFTGDGELRDQDGVACVYTKDADETTWTLNVPEAGYYQVRLDYLTVASRGVDIERSLYINGTLPFSGASTLVFSRQWMDAGEVRQDNQGNDIRPSQVEYFAWQQAFCKDDMGYESEPYRFWFEAGENTLTLKAVNEPMLIGAITLVPQQKLADYASYRAAQPTVQMSGSEFSTTIQGEKASLRSSPSLYARYDRSSSITVPYSVDHNTLNYIGGDAWANAGQWIQWDFEVPEDGYYNITIKARQQYQRGSISCRTLYIDGAVPFEEMSAVEFRYDTTWNTMTLSDEKHGAYQFYLTAGKHTIRLEATLGTMGGLLQEMENSIYRLNLIYRKVLVLTGVNPDRFRDYNIQGVYPLVIDAMELESLRLYKLVDDAVAITGQKSDRVAVAQTLAVQLEGFVEHNERITQSFANFKDNITSLGTAMQNMAQTKLDIDEITVSKVATPVTKKTENWFGRFFHEIRSCFASFFVDYNSLGDKYDANDKDVLEVWIVTGRDQSTILKTLVDDSFTPATGIKVNVKLVAADAVLTAVVAGNGPDIVLSVDNWFAVNYAMRNAVEDLTQFEDFNEVAQAFYPSALTPLTYDNGKNGKAGVYGLPETQLYSVLFYRTDILEELGLQVPNTWRELIAMLPTIQGNNMSVGIPYPDIVNPDISVLVSMIYQNGGAIYTDDVKRTVIDSESGVAAFDTYTSLYNDYGLPTVYDFVSRFRSGEMPIGVASYNTYNTLTVSAPEIRGLWNFALLPGTLKEDGTIDRTCHSAGACCMMIATDDEHVKQNAWTFMKWWISAESQVNFGRELESVMGSSARYTTANREALKQLAWSSAQLEILQTQQSWTRGFPEIAGGYSTTRHITNAVRKVINDKDDPRETLLNYTRTINEEIVIKRREFGLPTD